MPPKIDNSIQKERAAQGLTQQALAEKVGVTRQTIIALEKGSYTPSLMLAMKLAIIFNIPIETLFCIKDL